MRANLEQGRKVCDVELKRLAPAPHATDSAEPRDVAKAIALAAFLSAVASGHDGDHATAS